MDGTVGEIGPVPCPPIRARALEKLSKDPAGKGATDGGIGRGRTSMLLSPLPASFPGRKGRWAKKPWRLSTVAGAF